MILVLSGTQEGKEVIGALFTAGLPVMGSTVSEYGKKLIQNEFAVPVLTGELDREGLLQAIDEYDFTAIVDATHPFAGNISNIAIECCNRKNILYIRFERPSVLEKFSGDLIHKVKSFQDGAKKALEFPGNIFSTIGSNHLEEVCRDIPADRLVVRVLPLTKVIEKCERFGLNPSNIIAMQGPFSEELNRALFTQYNTGVLLTKDSGSIGGVEEKIQAAIKLEIPIIMVERPEMNYPRIIDRVEDIVPLVQEQE